MYPIYKGEPPKNITVSSDELSSMICEANANVAARDELKAMHERATMHREEQASVENMITLEHEQSVAANTRMEQLAAIKKGFLSAAMMKLFNECVEGAKANDIRFMQALVDQFITEQGVDNLLFRFKTRNVMLAEMGRIVRENYERVLAEDNPIVDIDMDPYRGTVRPAIKDEDIPGRAKDIKLTQDDADNFYRDLNGLDVGEASKIIRDKVSDAIGDFLDQNIQAKADYSEIINQAKERIADATEESYIQEHRDRATIACNDLRNNRQKNVFQYMMEAVTKATYKDEALKQRYMTESGKLNMNGIAHQVELMYTMLEMVNTTEMVDEDYVKNYIKSMLAM